MARVTTKAFGVAITVAALSTGATARADDASDLAGLLEENVVQGASKTIEAAKDAPATISSLSSDDIHRYGIRTLDEAIDFLSMGLVTSDPLHKVEVGGRGVLLTADFGNHVQLIVDGHVMNEAYGSTAYYERGFAVPIELIDNIEIMLGPGSVLYGNNAMLAVINVRTKSAASYGGLRLIGEGSLSPEQAKGGKFTSFKPGELGGSWRLSTGIGHEFRLFGKQAEVTAQIERYQQDGPSFEFGPQSVVYEDGSLGNFGSRAPLGVWGGRVNNAYASTVNAGYVRFILGDLTISTRAATFHRKTPYTNYYNLFFSNFDDPRGGELDRWLSLDLRYTKQLSPRAALVLHASGDTYDYQQQVNLEEGFNCSVPAAGPCRFELYGVSRWGSADANLTYDWLGNDRFTSLIGATGQLRFIGGKTDTLDLVASQQLGTVGKKSDYELPWGAFFQQRWSPVRELHLNGGARFDNAPRGGSRLSPRVAAAADIWHNGVLKAIYSEAFRAPTWFEAYFEIGGQVPAPNLKPEVTRSVEATFEQRLGQHKVMVGAFRTWWSDMIALRLRDDGNNQYQNVDSIDNYGYNARAEGALGQFRYGLSATGAHSRRTTPDGKTPLPVAPQLFGNARVAYDLSNGWPTVALATHLVGPRLADRALDGGFPEVPEAPAQIRFRLTLSGDVPKVPGLSYRLGVNFATASRSAYVAGPVQFVDPSDPAAPFAELAPVNRLTGFTTLQYQF